MKKNIILSIIAAGALVLGFQNCSQTGFQFSEDTLGKMSYDEARGPLVIDVAEMVDAEAAAVGSADQTQSTDNLASQDSTVGSSQSAAIDPVSNEVVKDETIVADIEVVNEGQDRAPASDDDVTESEQILDAYACGGGKKGMRKVYVCHHPQGNPQNKHTLCVGFPAARALLAQGRDAQQNYLGQCL